MSVLKAWLPVAVFGNLGMLSAVGVQLPKQPDCQTYCFMDALGRFQESTGSLTLASLFFFCGFIGFMFFAQRG